jgi:hypothetical protein
MGELEKKQGNGSWPPFAPGHTLSTKSGFWASPMLREPDRQEVAEIAASIAGLMPVFRPTFSLPEEQLACKIWRARRAYQDLSEHGLIREEGKPAPVLAHLATLENSIARDVEALWGAAEQMKVNSTHPVHPELHQFAGDVSWFLNAIGFIGGAALVIAASVIAMRAAVVPRWLGWLSLVVGIAVLVSFLGIPQIVWGVWVLAVSVGLFRGERATTSARIAAAT